MKWNTKKLPIKTKTTMNEAIELCKEMSEFGHGSRLVGGCVRDLLMEVAPKDFDIATQATPDEVCSFFKQKNKVIPTGISHGTVTVIGKFSQYEFTSLRTDKETDGRHAVVEFGDSFEVDSSRRDFTINALSMDIGGEIHDYHGGMSDIQSHTLKFVGKPQTRIHEDYLRILRFFRFWGQTGFEPEANSLKACDLLLPESTNVSSERITDETLKLLGSQYSKGAISHLLQTKGWQKITNTKPLIVAKDLDWVLKCSNRDQMKLLWMIQGVDTGRLKLSKKQLNTLASLERFHILPKQGWEDQAQKLLFAEKTEAQTDQPFPDYYGEFWSDYNLHKKTYQNSVTTELVLTDRQKGHLRRTKPPKNGHKIMQETGLKGNKLGKAVEAHRVDYLNEKISP